MRLPDEAHTSYPWLIHALAPDFELEDVWALPTPGRKDDFPRMLDTFVMRGAPGDFPTAFRALFALRWQLGKLFGWDSAGGGLDGRVTSLRDRLPKDLREGPRGPDIRAVPAARPPSRSSAPSTGPTTSGSPRSPTAPSTGSCTSAGCPTPTAIGPRWPCWSSPPAGSDAPTWPRSSRSGSRSSTRCCCGRSGNAGSSRPRSCSSARTRRRRHRRSPVRTCAAPARALGGALEARVVALADAHLGAAQERGRVGVDRAAADAVAAAVGVLGFVADVGPRPPSRGARRGRTAAAVARVSLLGIEVPRRLGARPLSARPAPRLDRVSALASEWMSVVREQEPWDALLASGRVDERLVRQAMEHGRHATIVPIPPDLDPEVHKALGAAASTRSGATRPRRSRPPSRARRSSPPAPPPASRCASSCRRCRRSPPSRWRGRCTCTPPRRWPRTRRGRCTRSTSSGCSPRSTTATPPREHRAEVRRRANLILTNPDMLHLGILPNHTQWERFFSGLAVVVIDEAHVYRGVFGSHVANVLRRLRRIAAVLRHRAALPARECHGRQPG